MPFAQMRCGGKPVTSRPRNRTLPASGRVKPATHENSVVLPAPFGPIRATTSLAPTSIETWSMAAKPPNDFVRLLTSSMARFPAALRKQADQAVGQPGDDGDQDGTVDDDAERLGIADTWQHAAEVTGHLAHQVQHA